MRASGVPFTILRPVADLRSGREGQSRAARARPPRRPCRCRSAISAIAARCSRVDNLISAIRLRAGRRLDHEARPISSPIRDPLAACRYFATLRAGRGRRAWSCRVRRIGSAAAALDAGATDLWDRIGGSCWRDPGKLLAPGWRPPSRYARGARPPWFRPPRREIRHRIAQHAIDRGALLARQPLLQRREPAAHGVERRLHRTRGHDAGDADLRHRLLAREQDFVQPLARPDAGEHDVDVAAGLEAGQAGSCARRDRRSSPAGPC